MTMNQNPNLRNQQNQMAQNVARNNPQLARGIAGMTSSFAQHMGQMNHQAPVQQAQAQPQPQPRVVSPFVPNQAQMAAFQSMFGGAKPAAAARPAAPVAPPKPRIDRRLSPCQYTLRNTIATKPTLTNGASGFTMKSRSRAGQVKAGSPVEVSIAPFSEAYQHLNFTSFIMYAKPTSNMAAVPEYMMEFMPPVAPTVNKHVGVFQVFRQYAAGAGAMKCSPTSKQEDSVGAFEDLILPESQPKPARNKVSVLWWPDAEALKYPEVIFTANIQSNGYWYKISSTPWKVIRPIDIQARRKYYQAQHRRRNDPALYMERMQAQQERQQLMQEQMVKFERLSEGKPV